MQVKKYVVALVLCLMLPLSGCAAVMAALPEVAAVISDATAVLQIIERALDSWFAVSPPDAETRQEANLLLSDAWSALRVATFATRGAQDMSEEDKRKAFEEFRKAYSELHAFLMRHGVLQGSMLSLGGGKTQDIPEPLALGL